MQSSTGQAVCASLPPLLQELPNAVVTPPSRYVGTQYTVTDTHRKTPTGRSVYFRSEELLAFRRELMELGAEICLSHDGGERAEAHGR